MANWKENKVVGIVAGIVFIISLIFVIKSLIPKPVEKTPVLNEETIKRQLK